MTDLHRLQKGMNEAWERVVEGWRQLHEHAAHAITRFIPGKSSGDLSSAAQQDIAIRNAGWGVLAAEVYNQGDKVVVKLEAPGMERDDFDLKVIDDLLVVAGEKQVETQRDEGSYHITECAYGRFERRIPLPDKVQSEGAKANYRRGVLRVELPKLASRKQRTIPVESA